MKTHGKAEVVDHHLADLPLLLELVLRVQVVVPVRADTVDLVAGEGISFFGARTKLYKVPGGRMKREIAEC